MLCVTAVRDRRCGVKRGVLGLAVKECLGANWQCPLGSGSFGSDCYVAVSIGAYDLGRAVQVRLGEF